MIVPLSQFPGFAELPPRAFKNLELTPAGSGVHFPEIDEYISIESLSFRHSSSGSRVRKELVVMGTPRQSIRLRLTTMMLGIVAAGLLACVDDTPAYVRLSLQHSEDIQLPERIWVGDTVTVFAEVGTNKTGFMDRILYTSDSAPQHFSFSSADATIATLDPHGHLTGRSVGETQIMVVADEFTDTLRLIVSPAVAGLHQTVRPASPRVGDTVAVRLTPVDQAGNAVPDASVAMAALVPPSSIPVPWLSGSTTESARIVASKPGPLIFVASASRQTSHWPRWIAETLAVTVRAR
jgi:hypothetical protein